MAGTHPDVAGTHPDAAGARPRPAGTRPDPAGAGPDPAGTRPEPARQPPDDARQRPGTDGPAPQPARRVSREPNGPFLVEGPVEVVMEDGSIVRSDRPVVALCTCRRSEEFPWCDTSHRRRRRPPA
ncbi:hypothetical protein FRZ00_30330 [Streptomyces mobaraensis]|uniref:Iron-binding zinc finger CDGSH type domain-containing protein n=1 Tax=Streptomyces mobaraensis TaxID=35621 RepID=A0A5N5W128_STRMB|nr:hypothetical protein FRZ00_30330 [Streptomyces mobaraensis]